MLTTEFNALTQFQALVDALSKEALETTNIELEGKPIITVNWQPKAGGEKQGAFIEEVLAVAYAQLKAFNDVFPCRENAIALTNIEQSVLWLAQRKANRQHRDVDGKEAA